MKRALFVIFLLMVGAAGYAQPREGGASAATEMVTDPTLKSAGRGAGSGIVFEFTEDTREARVQIGSNMGGGNNWAITVSGPVSGEGKTTLFTSDALNSGATAELLFSHVFLSPEVRIIDTRFDEICALHRRQPVPMQAAPSPALDAPQGEGEHRKQDCGRADLTPVGQRIFDLETFPPVWTIGASAKIGRATFRYADPATFEDQSETHQGSAVSGTVGRFGPSPLLYYAAASWSHQSAFAGNRVQNFCTPLEGSSTLRCRNIAIGAPERSSTDVLELEARSFIGDRIGLAPRVVFDTDSREYAVKLPIYIRGGNVPFNGGINLAWDSVNQEVVASLFVGALPSILNSNN